MKLTPLQIRNLAVLKIALAVTLIKKTPQIQLAALSKRVYKDRHSSIPKYLYEIACISGKYSSLSRPKECLVWSPKSIAAIVLILSFGDMLTALEKLKAIKTSPVIKNTPTP